MSGDIEFADQEDFDHVLMDYEPLRTDRRFCPHCSKSLSLKTFKAHKRRFYNSQSEVWYKSQWMSETQSLASSSSSSLEDLELYSPPDAIGESEEDLDDSESPPMSDALSERAPDSEMTRSSTSESEGICALLCIHFICSSLCKRLVCGVGKPSIGS